MTAVKRAATHLPLLILATVILTVAVTVVLSLLGPLSGAASRLAPEPVVEHAPRGGVQDDLGARLTVGVR